MNTLRIAVSGRDAQFTSNEYLQSEKCIKIKYKNLLLLFLTSIFRKKREKKKKK